MHDNAAIFIIVAVKNQRGQRGGGISRRRGEFRHDGLHKLVNALPRLRAYEQGFRRIKAEVMINFLLRSLHIGTRKVYLVYDGHNGQVLLQGKVHIAHRLAFDTLRGIHEQQCPLAGSDGAAHLVAEIHMAWGIDKIQFIVMAVTRTVGNSHRLALYGNAPLPFQIHVIQNLLLHFAVFNYLRFLDKAVGKR